MKRLIVLILALLLLLTACGRSSVSVNQSLKGDYVMEEAAAAEAPMMMANGAAMDSGAPAETMASRESGSTIPENRKWIVTVDMTLETDDLETLQQALNERITALSGYVENYSVYNGSTRNNYRYRNANMTVRIPADQVTAFTQEVGGMANVVNNNLRREDVTLQYVDTEGRVEALKTEEARLLELLAGAETMSDLLEIEARLSDVRYELESYTSRLRTLDNQINYATVYLFIEEVQEYTPVEEPTFFERITEGFADSLEGLWQSLQDLAVFLVVSFPYILVYGGLALVVILVIRKLKKGKKCLCRRKKNAEPKQETDPEQK